jgi:8-oxo-dGTP pyrophosphatase MutT (NUDIX family)
MRLVWKLVACVVREGTGGPELLVVDHARGGTQIPRGELVQGEAHEVGVLRELAEETGLVDVEIVRSIGTWERHTMAAGVAQEQRWEVFELRSLRDLEDEWVHDSDNGVLRCHWLTLDLFAIEAMHPVFGHVVEMLLESRTT